MIATKPEINIKQGEHVAIVGTTGSGKTVIARHLLHGMRRVIVLDPKHEFMSPGFKLGRALPIIRREFRTVHRPMRGLGGDIIMRDLVGDALKAKNVIIYVDELATVSDYFPLTRDMLQEVARVGRSRNVSIWTATQRPRWVPKTFFTESRVMLMFSLMSKDDRDHMAGFLTEDARQQINLHNFWYHRAGMLQPALLKLDLHKRRILEVM